MVQLVGFQEATRPSTPATPRKTPHHIPLPTVTGGPLRTFTRRMIWNRAKEGGEYYLIAKAKVRIRGN